MYSDLLQLLSPTSVSLDEPMRNHTTFKIGGPADVLVTPENIEELKTALQYCSRCQVPFLVFGAGSNLLVRDKGIRGVAIKITNINAIEITGQEVYAQAGILLSDLAYTVAGFNLAGLEFAEGIPGSLGGAVVMNAGAYDGEMAEVVLEVDAISPSGESVSFSRSQLDYGYRHSIFQNNRHIVVAARLGLKLDDESVIKTRMNECSQRRRDKQPLDYPSAGSTFRRPPGHFVGPMIEELGLKGYSVGGAQVSAKHTGFIVNTGQATAEDVLQLIGIIQAAVEKKFGLLLQPEIRIVGEA